MFTIIGGDGQEYGPATAEQLRAWIAAGRANLDTKAKAAGSDEWRPLRDYPEFAAPAAPAGLPPVVSPALVAETDLADRGSRLLARILDELFVLLCALPGIGLLGLGFIQAVASRQEEALDNLDLAQAGLGLFVLFAGILTITIVQIWMISTRGQTIAKRIFDLRIVRADNGQLPGFLHGWLLRNFVVGLIGLVPFGLGTIFMIVDSCFIFRSDRRCLHDLIAGTRVVKVPPAEPRR